jgi:hypothetical protein
VEAKEDPLRGRMQVERTRREDGRALLLYTWPAPIEPATAPQTDEPPLEPWSPDSGPTDV